MSTCVFADRVEDVGIFYGSVLQGLVTLELVCIPERTREESAGPVIDSAEAELAQLVSARMCPERVLEHFLAQLIGQHVHVISHPYRARHLSCAVNVFGCQEQLAACPVDAGLDPSIIFLPASCQYGHGNSHENKNSFHHM